MKNVNWSTVVALALIALVIFMTWGALGGWSGTMGLGMGTGFDGAMTFVGLLALTCFLALLFFWVVQNLSKKNYPASPNLHPALQICSECGSKVSCAHFCSVCGAPLP